MSNFVLSQITISAEDLAIFFKEHLGLSKERLGEFFGDKDPFH